VDDFLLGVTKFAGKFDCHFGHALSVSLGFAVAQVKRQHPAFNGPIVGLLEGKMGFFQRLLRTFAVCDVT